MPAPHVTRNPTRVVDFARLHVPHTGMSIHNAPPSTLAVLPRRAIAAPQRSLVAAVACGPAPPAPAPIRAPRPPEIIPCVVQQPIHTAHAAAIPPRAAATTHMPPAARLPLGALPLLSQPTDGRLHRLVSRDAVAPKPSLPMPASAAAPRVLVAPRRAAPPRLTAPAPPLPLCLPCDICGHGDWSRCEHCNGIVCDVASGGCGRGRHHPWGPYHGLPCSCPRGPGPPDPAPPVARRA